ncbi:helix-turn-helix transcriptional regulator [Silvimonas iriomotensis]|uniref:AraC family transcriptional regulator n=1 Tax=Silvimonas iriomotensis TaxID=449662 RepID=A0ABQ2PE16_9NEIS|nr:AraC family transcriptional regulator [Silvimonas iriomotensis]GGP23400.1 AraC family transcriptional regulator [Silvimonas iriomotensis]
MERTITTRPGIGASAHILQYGGLEMARVPIDLAMLILVTAGSKLMRWGDEARMVEQGQAIVIAPGQTFDVTNRRPHAGVYESVWLAWEPAIMAPFAAGMGQMAVADACMIERPDQTLLQSIAQARAALADNSMPAAIATHRMQEVLLCLAMQGVRFKPEAPATLTQRVRALIKAAPAHDWRGPDLAAQLAMSEATLRRKLAAEGMSLSDLLVDVRMSLALIQLQSTDHPVSQIALDSGYESQSRFAIRFRKRFGFAPSEVRGHLRHPEPGQQQGILRRA